MACLQFCASFIILLSTIPAISPSSVNVSENDIEDLCKNTIDAQFCVKVLKSDPRTPKADFEGLTQISIDLSRSFVLETSAMLASLAKNDTQSALMKSRYTACLMQYGRSLNDMEYANECLKIKYLRGIYMAILSSKVAAGACTREFETPPADKSGLIERNRKLRIYGQIIVLASVLMPS